MSNLNSSTQRLIRRVGMTILAFSIITTCAFAQSGRTVKSKVTPSYPELANKMHVNGVVKVELTVAANGTVKSAKAIGGHPLLIDAAVNAAIQFKYVAGEETKEIVEFKFNSGNN